MRIPWDGEMEENTDGPFTTHQFVLRSKQVHPICTMCGQDGRIFVFDGPDHAKVFCSGACQTTFEVEKHHDQYGEEILIEEPEKIAWVSCFVFTVVLALLTGFWHLSGPAANWFWSHFSK